MRRLGARAREHLEGALGVGSPALPFAAAVVRHLAGSSGREIAVAERVAELLRACERGAAPPAAVERLSRDPELMASFFQNADLLYAAGYGAADAVALLVMEAVGLATAREAGEEEAR